MREGQENFQYVRKDVLQVWEGSGGLPAGSAWVGKTTCRSRRAFRSSGSGRKDFSQVREGLRGLPIGPGGVEGTSHMSGKCRDDLPQVW